MAIFRVYVDWDAVHLQIETDWQWFQFVVSVRRLLSAQPSGETVNHGISYRDVLLFLVVSDGGLQKEERWIINWFSQ